MAGSISLAANATSIVGNSSVQFQLDGVALGSPVSGAGPAYVMLWDTTTAADGAHTIAAVATDTAGHQTMSAITAFNVVNQLQLNQRVEATASLNVYGTPSISGNVLGTETQGALGTIAAGPTSDGVNSWWQVNYDDGLSGWTISGIISPLPSLTIPVNNWVVVQPSYAGAPNGGQLYPQGWNNKGTYDPVTHRLILSDRWADPVRSYISIFGDGIYAYDPVQNLFTILKLNNWYAQANPDGSYTTLAMAANATDPTPPDHHPLTSLEVVPEQNAVYTVNGVNSISLPDPSILNKTWKFSLSSRTWTMLSSDTSDANYPPNNINSTSGLIYDPVIKKLVYLVPSYCGCSGTASYLFDPATNAWSAPSQDPSSLGVYIAGAGVTYDSKRGLIMAYGGNHYSTETGTAKLWAYSVSQNLWTRLADAPVTGTAPAFVYDPKHDIFLALVGNNTYFYNPNTNTWSQYPATLNRPISAQAWQGVTYDPAHDLFLFEGGTQPAPLMALFRYDPNTPPTLTIDTIPPTVSITAPLNGATVTGTVSFLVTASDPIDPATTDNVGVIGLQYQLDGANMTGVIAGPGPYSIARNTTASLNGPHTLTAIAYDVVGNTASRSISVTVNNPVSGPVISGVNATSIIGSSATINWTTDKASDSQVFYGLTNAYGSQSPVGSALVTSHSILLSGLASSTTYHYEVLSRDAQSNLTTSVDFTFSTAATGLSPLFQSKTDATEVSGTTNGAVITPTVAPAGFTGNVVVTGAGSVNFAAAQTGNGVYFLNCCVNTNMAYFKFTGAAVGNIFNMSQGQVSFYLKSRYSFAQRKTSAAAPRYAFDVRDGNTSNHLFYFQTSASSSALQFGFRAGGNPQFYYVPAGTEDALFGNGVLLKVTVIWGGSVTRLYLNDSLVQAVADTTSTPNWTTVSNFDVGAYEYSTFGGYNTSDDIIDEFTVMGPAALADATPPTISMTAPSDGAMLAGIITVSANATDNVGVTGVQFLLDGANLGNKITGSGPYSVSWNTTTVSNTSHALSAVASDAAGNTSTATPVSITVNNPPPPPPPVISGVSAGPITSSGATVTWTTDTASDSQVAYGISTAYGSLSSLASALVTTHSVALSGLAPSTTYHYQVLSRDAQTHLSTSTDFTFTTTSQVSLQPVLQLHADATEVSGITNGSIVTPSMGPAGFTGAILVNGSGSVNFAPAQVGNGVYFLNCCSNTNTAYYKFMGPTVGNVFNVSQGQVSFNLVSRYSFAQRKASAAAPRYSFDVRDASNHLFYFFMQVTSGRLVFSYSAGGATVFYYVPQGSEDTLFGNGVILNVTMAWDGSTVKLYCNGVQVQASSYTQPAPNWTSASTLDIGAYEYLAFGGYNTLDDVIDEFTVMGSALPPDTTSPIVSISSPAGGSTVSGPVTVSANASDNVGVTSLQFLLDGANLGNKITGSGPYSVSWNTTTATNTSHTISAIAGDAAGNTTTATGVSVTVSNVQLPPPPPVISGVAARSITSSGATITWNTDTASDSQVSYGTTTAYDLTTTLAPALVTAHSVTLSGLASSTAYHYQVLSRDSQSNLSTSTDFTFTTAAASSGSPLLQLQLDAAEVTGTTNGSIVFPSAGPAGFTGTVVAKGTGSVNFAPAQVGNGVYFLNCCTNTNNAYYQFTGAAIGSIFNVNQGQISFYLQSRRSFSQRLASGTAARYAFDVRDNNVNNHLFLFLTQIASGRLVFSYRVGNTSSLFYYVPVGNEDTLFGNGATVKVTMTWDGSIAKLYLNDVLTQSSAYTKATPNWTAASNFDVGAYEYQTFGGYNSSDDIIDEITVQ